MLTEKFFMRTCALLGCLLAQNASSACDEDHPEWVKTLSRDEYHAYLTGGGFGMAKAAELNHYPGPKHVLELASELGLSASQRQDSQQIYQTMHIRAVSLGKQLIFKECELNQTFANGVVEPSHVQEILQEIGALKAALRNAHLRAHIEQAQGLSPQQRQHYDRLRGYADTLNGSDHQHHGH